MKILICLFFLPPLVLPAFTELENLITFEVLSYFESRQLDFLGERFDPDLEAYLSNSSFPSRQKILTSVLTPELLLRRQTQGQMPTVVARDGTSTWTQFKKLATSSVMRTAKWILFTSQPQNSASITGLYIPFDCEFVVVNTAKTTPTFSELYHVSEESEVISSNFGHWNSEGHFEPPKTYIYNRRPDFKGHTFKAYITQLPPYIYASKLRNGSYELSGYFYEIWKELETRLKFRTNYIYIPPDKKARSYIKDGETAFTIAPTVQEPKTADHASFLEPIYEAKIYLFGNRPGSELEWNSYLKPFSTETWLATLAWMAVSSLALGVLYYLAWKQQTSESETGYYVFRPSICLETVFRAMCAQGSDVTPRSNACRLFFLSIYLTALVVSSAFSAALFSLLTIPVSKAPFNSFPEVYNSRGYKMGVILDTDIHEHIKDLSERFPKSDHDRLYKMMEPNEQQPSEVTTALDRVCRNKDYIFMWDLPNVLEVMKTMTRSCQEKIMPGGPMVFKDHIGFACNRGNPYKELMDLQLIRLKNEGVLRRLLLNTWPPRIPNVQSSWVRVTLADISPILYMFAIGVVLGCLFLLIENLYKKMRTKDSKAKVVMERHTKTSESVFDPTEPVDPWKTRYRNWSRSDSGPHLRQRERLHYR